MCVSVSALRPPTQMYSRFAALTKSRAQENRYLSGEAQNSAQSLQQITNENNALDARASKMKEQLLQLQQHLGVVTQQKKELEKDAQLLQQELHGTQKALAAQNEALHRRGRHALQGGAPAEALAASAVKDIELKRLTQLVQSQA